MLDTKLEDGSLVIGVKGIYIYIYILLLLWVQLIPNIHQERERIRLPWPLVGAETRFSVQAFQDKRDGKKK